MSTAVPAPVVADADVVQSAVVAQGEFAVAVDAVSLRTRKWLLTWIALPCRGGAWPGGPGLRRGVCRLMPRCGRLVCCSSR